MGELLKVRLSTLDLYLRSFLFFYAIYSVVR
jgi:hypothetical protein